MSAVAEFSFFPPSAPPSTDSCKQALQMETKRQIQWRGSRLSHGVRPTLNDFNSNPGSTPGLGVNKGVR
jgi:hypothetical protein